MRPVLLCINRDRGTVTRYVPVGKQLFTDTIHEIADRIEFERTFTVADCERVRTDQGEV